MNDTNQPNRNAPVAKYRAGAVECALWANRLPDGQTMLKASLERRYRDRDGNWKSATRFTRSEIPLAVHCLQKAFERMLKEEAHQREEQRNGGEPDAL